MEGCGKHNLNRNWVLGRVGVGEDQSWDVTTSACALFLWSVRYSQFTRSTNHLQSSVRDNLDISVYTEDDGCQLLTACMVLSVRLPRFLLEFSFSPAASATSKQTCVL